VKLLLNNLKLYQCYDDKYIFVSKDSFSIINNYILMYLNQISEESDICQEMIEIIHLIFQVCSKIFNITSQSKISFNLKLLSHSLLS